MITITNQSEFINNPNTFNKPNTPRNTSRIEHISQPVSRTNLKLKNTMHSPPIHPLSKGVNTHSNYLLIKVRTCKGPKCRVSKWSANCSWKIQRVSNYNICVPNDFRRNKTHNSKATSITNLKEANLSWSEVLVVQQREEHFQLFEEGRLHQSMRITHSRST